MLKGLSSNDTSASTYSATASTAYSFHTLTIVANLWRNTASLRWGPLDSKSEEYVVTVVDRVSVDVEAVVQEFERTGYVVIPGLYSPGPTR